jgi:hypothetical protein
MRTGYGSAARSIRMFGGNVSSSGIPVSINAVGLGGVVKTPKYLMFPGTTFYNDFAPWPPCAIQNNAGADGVPVLQANESPFPLMC